MGKNIPLIPVFIFAAAVGWIMFQVATPDPQLGGHFEGIPYAIYDDAALGPEGGYTVYLTYGVRGTSGNWKEVRLYGLGSEFIPMLEAAIQTETWLEFETEDLGHEWYSRFGIQGYIQALSVSESQGYDVTVAP